MVTWINKKALLTLACTFVLLMGYQNCGDNGKDNFSSRKPAPLILLKGLVADSVATKSKIWNWGCEQSNGESLNCTYRFTVNQSDNHEFIDEPYGNQTSYTKSSGTGTFWLHVQAKDEMGVESEVKSISAKLDNKKPTVRNLSNDHVVQMSKTWNWGCNDETSAICTYQFAVTTTRNHTFDSSSYGVIARYTQHGGQGIYFLHVQAKDEAGNESEIKSVSVTLDNTKPLITGLENDNVPAASKTWNWNCDKAPCTYRYLINGVSNHTFSPSDIYRTMSPATISKNDGTGTFWLHVQTKDQVGNESEVISVSTILDNVLPVVTGLSSDSSPRQSKTWTWGCNKSNCSYRFAANQSANHTFNTSTGYGSIQTKTVNTTQNGTGTWYLHVQARDSMNNESAVISVSVQLNDTPLTVTGLSSNPTPVKSKTWQWNCNEANCEYRSVINQSANHTFSKSYGSQNTATKSSGNGTWYLHVQARENNRQSTVESVSVILDNTDPTLTGIENDQTVRPSKTWEWNCNETSPSSCEYRFEVNQSANHVFSSNDLYQAHPTTTTQSNEGSWYLHVQARDTAGNESGVKSVSVTLDNTGPQVTELENDTTPAKSKTWQWSCNETPAINCRYRAMVNKSSVYVFPANESYQSQLTTFTKNSEDGIWYLHVQAKDNADNESAVVSVSTILDNTKPTLEGLENDTTPVKSKTWSWLCNNGESCTYRHQIRQCELSPPAADDSCRTHTFTSESYGDIKTASQSGDGVYYIHVQAIDEAGNESQVLSVSTELYTVVQALADGPSGNHNCVLFTNNTAKCWGYNKYGQLGQGDTSNRGDKFSQLGRAHLDPIPFGTDPDGVQYTAKAISVGESHSCAILNNDSLKCWGRNNYGQLGTGDNSRESFMDLIGDALNEMQSSPTVDLGSDRTAKAVSAGSHHTCALLDDNSVKCWGRNNYGQLGKVYNSRNQHLGDDSSEMGNYLTTIDLGANTEGTQYTAKAISAGAYHTCALLDNNSVKCWGRNNYGQLGQGDRRSDNRGDHRGEMGNSLVAVNLGSERTIQSISSGHDHTCALLDNNSVKCWGHNNYGQLGQGNTNSRGIYPSGTYGIGDDLDPINLGVNRTVKAISAGAYHTCALLDNNHIRCWGRNSYGQLGLNNNRSYGDGANEMGTDLPIVNLGTSGGTQHTAKAISTGFYHSCALMDNDKVKCWGRNNYGQLGQGHKISIGNISTPSSYGKPMENLVEIPL